MSNNKSTTVVQGTSLSTLLTVLFVGLKLTGVINWSWWWVVSPLWISWGLVLLIFIAAGIFLGLHKVITNRRTS